MSAVGPFVIRTRQGDRGPFSREQIQELVGQQKLPLSAQILDQGTGRPVAVAAVVSPPEPGAIPVAAGVPQPPPSAAPEVPDYGAVDEPPRPTTRRTRRGGGGGGGRGRGASGTKRTTRRHRPSGDDLEDGEEAPRRRRQRGMDPNQKIILISSLVGVALILIVVVAYAMSGGPPRDLTRLFGDWRADRALLPKAPGISGDPAAYETLGVSFGGDMVLEIDPGPGQDATSFGYYVTDAGDGRMSIISQDGSGATLTAWFEGGQLFLTMPNGDTLPMERGKPKIASPDTAAAAGTAAAPPATAGAGDPAATAAGPTAPGPGQAASGTGAPARSAPAPAQAASGRDAFLGRWQLDGSKLEEQEWFKALGGGANAQRLKERLESQRIAWTKNQFSRTIMGQTSNYLYELEEAADGRYTLTLSDEFSEEQATVWIEDGYLMYQDGDVFPYSRQ